MNERNRPHIAFFSDFLLSVRGSLGIDLLSAVVTDHNEVAAEGKIARLVIVSKGDGHRVFLANVKDEPRRELARFLALQES